MADNQKIIAFLKTRPDGATLSEISDRTGHGRATVGKYLEMLKLEGKAAYKGVGRAKLWFLIAEKKTKLLIVDDEPGILKLLRLSFREAEYDITESMDGVAALEAVKEKMPDIVILDVMLPRLSGMDVCRQMKENILTRNIPVIMLTAKDELTSRVKGISYGADDYVSKPFDVIDLKERVKSLLQRSADRNPVTNLPSKRILAEKMEKASGEDLAAISLYFRDLVRYGSRNGKQKENEFLKIVSQVITHSIGSSCFAAHIREDFFIVLCPRNDLAGLKGTLQGSLLEILPFMEDSGSMLQPEITVLDGMKDIRTVL